MAFRRGDQVSWEQEYLLTASGGCLAVKWERRVSGGLDGATTSRGLGCDLRVLRFEDLGKPSRQPACALKFAHESRP
jgi:hypothetical protein